MTFDYEKLADLIISEEEAYSRCSSKFKNMTKEGIIISLKSKIYCGCFNCIKKIRRLL